jgi:diacylglycerol kinase (ATP)
VNTHSRRGKQMYEEAKAMLSSLDVRLVSSVECSKMPRMLAEARKAVRDRVPVLIVGGGDGTFNALANVLVGSETALGVLPLGTGNAFARDLGVPADVTSACRIIATGKLAQVDVGIANGQHFLNVATVGLTTSIASSLQESLKRRYGRIIYLYAVIKAYRQIQPFEATLQTENGSLTFPTLQVVIGNGRYHAGPFRLAPDAGITTGRFSVYALESAHKTSLLKLALHLPSGDYVKLPEVHSESTFGGTLTCSPARRVTLDGEVGPQTPLKFEVAPRSLRVVVPNDFPG